MIKRKAYLFCLWLATLMVLSTTLVPHHHHAGVISVPQRQCTDAPEEGQHHVLPYIVSDHSKETQETNDCQKAAFVSPYSIYSLVSFSPRSFIHKFRILLPRGYLSSGGLRAPPVA
jgi:ferredoxin-thioredoxin reductase catalytic subunit